MRPDQRYDFITIMGAIILILLMTAYLVNYSNCLTWYADTQAINRPMRCLFIFAE